MSEDKINPQHYDGDLCNCAIAMITKTMSGIVAVDIGFAIKHLWRRGRKPGEDKADDLGKARWYLTWIETTMGFALKASEASVIARLRELAERDADVRFELIVLATGSQTVWCSGRACEDGTCDFCREQTSGSFRDRWYEFLRNAERLVEDANAPTKRMTQNSLDEEGSP